VYLERLELRDFRNYRVAEITFPDAGVVVLRGRNGQGKTNMLEAIGYMTSLHSFRSPTNAALVRAGADAAILRALGKREQRELLVEAEIAGSSGRTRTLVNKQTLRRSADFSDVFASVVFAPDDLSLVKGGPSERRDYIDDILARCDKRVAQLQSDVDRVVKQRNTLLRQAGGRISNDIAHTLDVWDQRLTDFGETLGAEREQLVNKLRPLVEQAYIDISDAPWSTIDLKMLTEWRVQDGNKGLAEALRAARGHDVQRGITSVGPHRDEFQLLINDLPARTHASQGEQRTFALALRLAAYRHLTTVLNDAPILLLDDVFSELDDGRSRKLLSYLTGGQMFLTTATDLPSGVEWSAMFEIDGGAVKSQS
jgi:DNA replication and repair protein RecF